MNLLLIAILPLLAQASPFEAQARDSCGSDNCLRELRGTSSLASPYCATYYTSTTTVTTVTTVPALDATFPPIKKREPTAAPEIMKRTTGPLPSFAQSCTGAATALSSGCSCLLGSHAATTTTTTTSTRTLPLPTQCNSAHSYGLYPTPLLFAATDLPPGQGASGLGFETWPGGCCAFCLASPNCIMYNEDVNYVASVPGKVGCSVDFVGPLVDLPLGHPSCPLGTVALTAYPAETSALYGRGGCGRVVATTTATV